MTEAFAGAATVSIPVLALAAGAEARTIRDRLRRPDQQWEDHFKRYAADNELDLGARPADVFAYFRGVPGLSKLYVVERAVAICGAFLWLAVFILLTIAEIRCMAWLADGAVVGNPGLAEFTLVCIALAMIMLIIAPAVYLVLPVLLPLDLVPRGLKDAVGPKLGDQQGRSFIRQLFTELEGAVERTAEKLDAEKLDAEKAGKQAPHTGASADAAPPPELISPHPATPDPISPGPTRQEPAS